MIAANLGATLPVALGDVFVLAVSARDPAGNVSDARILRVRARSFVDQQTPIEDLPPLMCTFELLPQLLAPTLLPRNGRIEVLFPFEKQPLALLPANGGDSIPLVPVEEIVVDGALGHTYATALPMPAGSSFTVQALDCPHCICPTCAASPAGEVVVGAEIDEEAPSPAEVVELIDDADPARAEGICSPDSAATLVVLRPGQDNFAAAGDFRYDVAVRLGDQPARPVGRSLVPLVRADGNMVVRLDTGEVGRLVGEAFELTLDAHDSAGNSARTLYVSDEALAATGCGCSNRSDARLTIVVALLLLLPLRRRR